MQNKADPVLLEERCKPVDVVVPDLAQPLGRRRTCRLAEHRDPKRRTVEGQQASPSHLHRLVDVFDHGGSDGLAADQSVL